jgi:hypothetical protein
MRIPFISLLAAGMLALGGCAYDSYGMGLGYGGGYGYGYGDYGYGGPYYGDYGYGYGAPYFGWYDDAYYPGTGIYVYDSYRRPHTWSDRQRSYWTSRRQATSSSSGKSVNYRENWSGFNRRRQRPSG